MSSSCARRGARPIKSKDMKPKMFIGLSEDDLLKIEQITLDHDAEAALVFIKQVIKKEVDRANASKMKREDS